jgi:ATP-dependent Clp endopeptidase proteolytic subunit ClpP
MECGRPCAGNFDESFYHVKSLPALPIDFKGLFIPYRLKLLAGEKGKRSALPNSEIMIHQPLGGAQGQASDIEISAKRIIQLRKLINQIISERTGQPFDKVDKDTERDYFMSADEAKQYGIIDQVVKRYYMSS